MGKTLLSLALICYRRKLKELKSCLVLVPNKPNKTEWRREIRRHTSMDYLILKGSTKQKWEAIEKTTAPIIVETYGGLMRLCSELEDDERKRAKKGKKRLAPKAALVAKLKKKVNGLILDESTLVQTKGTLPYRLCRAIGKDACMLIELTGTPFGRDPEALWSQIHLLDGGHTLGETLGLYRSAFFTEKLNYWGGRSYEFKDSMKGKLHNFINHCTINWEADESDLPTCVSDVKYVSMPDETRHYFELSKRALQQARKERDGTGMQNSFLRLCQISSGFVNFKDEEGKGTMFFPQNPKLDMLESYIERIPPNHKFIIFHNFTPSGRMLSERLTRMKIKHVWLWGGAKNESGIRDQYEEDTKTQGLILQSKFGYGLNLQIARYGMFFEIPVPVIDRVQCTRRYIRQGSEAKRKFLTDFVMHDTFDQSILDWHKEGGDLYAAIVQGKFAI